ncbi:MAG: hypothetical protein GX022_08210 [Clostridiaceae bacterium]|nr:hypothetical protein [Clostridiaceae bacterium]
MSKKKDSILSIILYVLAGFLMIFGIWSTSEAISYISLMINQGQLEFRGHVFDIISFIMSSGAEYVIFALILFTLGWMLQKSQLAAVVVSEQDVTENSVESSEEIYKEE